MMSISLSADIGRCSSSAVRQAANACAGVNDRSPWSWLQRSALRHSVSFWQAKKMGDNRLFEHLGKHPRFVVAQHVTQLELVGITAPAMTHTAEPVRRIDLFPAERVD